MWISSPHVNFLLSDLFVMKLIGQCFIHYLVQTLSSWGTNDQVCGFATTWFTLPYFSTLGKEKKRHQWQYSSQTVTRRKKWFGSCDGFVGTSSNSPYHCLVRREFKMEGDCNPLLKLDLCQKQQQPHQSIQMQLEQVWTTHISTLILGCNKPFEMCWQSHT